MTIFLPIDLSSNGQPVLFLDPAKGAALTTIAAVSVDPDTCPERAKKPFLVPFGQVAVSPKADDKKDPRINVMEAILKMIAELTILESTLVKLNDEEMQRQALMGDATTTITHKLTEAQVRQLDAARIQNDKAESTSGILKWIGYVVTGLTFAFACLSGFGALLVTAAMFALQETGTMDKLCGENSPAWLKLAVTAAVGIAAGGLAAGIDVGIASARGVGNAVGEAAENAAENSAKNITTKDIARASFNFTSMTIGSQMLVQLNPIRDAMKSIFGDNDFTEALSAILTIIITVVAAVLAGGTVAGKMSPNIVKLFKVAGVLQVGAASAQTYFQDEQALNYKDMEHTEKERSEIDPALTVLKTALQLIQSLYQQTSQLTNTMLKNFQSDYENAAAVIRPWEATARALSGAA